MSCPNCGETTLANAAFCHSCGAKLGQTGDNGPQLGSTFQLGEANLIAGTFVGRQREMSELKSALQDAVSGQTRLLMLEGEPGIGKTRIVEEFTEYANQEGIRVTWGHCYENQGTPTYWPWIQIIRSYVGDDSEIGNRVPEMHALIAGFDPMPQHLEPQQARIRLFDAITGFLRDVSQNQPSIFVIEDLHWADEASLSLLEFVANELREARFLLIGTYRSEMVSRQHPLHKTLSELVRVPRFQQIFLKGLDPQNIKTLVIQSAGLEPSQKLVEDLVARTEGNPFFITEVIRLLIQEHRLTPGELPSSQEWTLPVPQGVRVVIGRRLDRLSHGSDQILTLAALLGDEFGFAQLRGITEDISEARLFEVLEESVREHVLEELPSKVGWYKFSHALIREVLIAELTLSQQARLHGRIAESLEHHYAAGAEDQAAELAYHFGKGVVVTGTDKFVRYSLLAGERALTSLAFDEALDYIQQALAAKEGHPMDADTAELRYGLARVQMARLQRHEIHQAITNLRLAFDYYVDVGDMSRALAIVDLPISPLPGLRTGAAELIAHALEMVEPDSSESGRLLALYGRAIGVEDGDYQKANDAFRQALNIASRDGDSDLMAHTLIGAAYVTYLHARWQESLEYGLQAVELVRSADDPYLDMAARYVVPLNLITMGRFEEARLHASTVLTAAERARDHFSLTSALWINEIVSHMEGDWHSARTFGDRALAVSSMDPRILFVRALLEYEVGDFEQGKFYLDKLLGLMRSTPPGPTTAYSTPVLIAAIAASVSNADEWSASIEAAGRSVLSSSFATPTVAQMARGGLALIAVLQNDHDAAKDHYTALAPCSGTFVAYCFAADRVLGLLSQTMGHFDAAMAHFEKSLDFCRKAGYRPELAWTCHDYARALLQRVGSSGDRENAVSLLNEASMLSQDLDMQPLLQLSLDLKVQATTQQAEFLKYPDGLTRREVDVLRLIAAGKSNREIAGELFISLSTTANHVTSIFNKTRVANRTEAAIYANRRDLV